ELTPPGHSDRGWLLTALVESAEPALSLSEQTVLLDEALVELRASGDELGIGRALLLQSSQAWFSGDMARAGRLQTETVDLLERHEPGPALAHAYATQAGRLAIAGEPEQGLAWAAKAMRLGDQLGLAQFVARALQFRGIARCDLGDFGGLDDLK